MLTSASVRSYGQFRNSGNTRKLAAVVGICAAMLPYLLQGTPEYGAFSDPDKFPIGGGAGYGAIVTNGDFVVTTGAALSNALTCATNGQVVFVPGDAVIDMTSYRNAVVPDGVTLASDRGHNGSVGALLYIAPRLQVNYSLLLCDPEARVTGLRLRGPDDSIGSVNAVLRPPTSGRGIIAYGGEIDNCEISHFGHSGVATYDDTYIHHNHIHDIGAYPVLSGEGHLLAEANYILFKWNAFDSSSGKSGGYTAQYNYLFKRMQPGCRDAINPVFSSHSASNLIKTVEIAYNTVVNEIELPDINRFTNLDPNNTNLTVVIHGNEFPAEDCDEYFWCPPSAIRTNNLHDAGLRAYYYSAWTFDATSGVEAADVSLRQNHAQIRGGAGFDGGSVAGQVMRALALDGQNDYVDAGDPADGSLDFGTGNFTLSAWIYPESSAGEQCLFCKHDGTAGYLVKILPGGILQAELKNAGYAACIVTSAMAFSTGAWHHVAAAYDRLDTGRVSVYLDGEEVGHGDCAGLTGAVDNAYAFLMGAAGNTDNASSHFKGRLDHARAYGRALSGAELYWAHQQGRMAGWWRLNEPAGTWGYNAAEVSRIGVLHGGSTFADASMNGKEEYCLWFDGVDDRMAIADDLNSGGLGFNAGNFSVAAWFYCAQPPQTGGWSNYRYIMSKLGQNSQGYIMYLDQNVTNTRLCCRFSAYDGVCHSIYSRKNITIGQWNHAAMTVDRSSQAMKVYINGVLSDTRDISSCTGSAASADTFNIGATGGDDPYGFFQGAIDDVRIYNGLLDAAQVQAIVDSSILMGHWTLDETAGAIAHDSSLHRNDASLYGGLDFATHSMPGPVGRALNFDGTNHYVSYGSWDGRDNLNFDDANFSVAAWFYCPETPSVYRCIVGKMGTAWQGYMMYLDQNNGNTRLCCKFTTYDGVGHNTYSRNYITIGQWNHAAMVVDRDVNTMKIYLNGGLIDTRDISACTGTAATDYPFYPLYIGAVGGLSEPFYRFLGAIDDVRIYRKALSADEVAALLP